MLINSEVEALLYLLEDPDTEVYQHIKRKIISIGPSVVPELNNMMEESSNVLVHSRIENILKQIQFDETCLALDNWCHYEQGDLLKGILLLTSYQYPDLNQKDMLYALMDIKETIMAAIRNENSPQRIISHFNRVLFQQFKFRTLNKSGQSPEYFNLGRLLFSGKGEVVTIALLYAMIADELDLPICLIRMPENKFLLAFFDHFFDRTGEWPSHNSSVKAKKSIRFFMDPTRKGDVLLEEDVKRRFFVGKKIEDYPAAYLPMTNVDSLALLLKGLIKYYEGIKDNEPHLSELYMLLSILSNKE